MDSRQQKYGYTNYHQLRNTDDQFRIDTFSVRRHLCQTENVSLSYTFPRSLIQKSKILSGVKLYVNADNLLTWFKDDWKGFDDIDIFGVGGYNPWPAMPLSRTVTFGVNLEF